jgi:GST-like protein
MIRLYTWSTPNGVKISIALEELGLDYEVITVDITRDEQFNPEFLTISPNNKIPVIVDGEITLFDSGAILLYLAHKTGKLAHPAGSLELQISIRESAPCTPVP